MIKIYAEIESLDFTLDYSNITDISCGIVTQADFDKPSYGIVSNSGYIEFNDYDGTIEEYIEKGLLKEGKLVRVYIENSLVPKEKRKVCEMYTDQWTYDTENKSVRVTLVDGLERLQDIEFAGIEYHPRTYGSLNYYRIYILLRIATEAIGIDVEDFLSSEVQEKLTYIVNYYPYMSACSLWNAWQQFAEATKTHIYKNASGELGIHL